ncbi:MAG: outer membrane protein [Hyphomicrobiaceae bacterium]
MKDGHEFAPPRYLWTGMYVGAQAGYGWGSSVHTDSFSASSGRFDMDGFVGGGTLGYNLQAGQIVWGIETDISFVDVSGSGGPLNLYTSSVDWLWTVRGRLGVDLNGWMPYVTGGLAVADVYASALGSSNSDTLMGYTIGGGLEIKLDRSWSTKVEYLFVDLGDLRLPATVRADFDELRIVRAGINYKF